MDGSQRLRPCLYVAEGPRNIGFSPGQNVLGGVHGGEGKEAQSSMFDGPLPMAASACW